MPAGDIYEMTVVQRMGTRSFSNVIYQKTVDDTGSTDPEKDAIDAFINQLIPDMQKVMTNDVTIECVLARREQPVSTPYTTRILNLSGTAVGDALPANQCMVLSEIGLPANRSNRGRMYLSGLPEEWVEEGRLLQDKYTNYDDLRASLINGYSDFGRDYRPVHHSRKLGTYVDITQTILRPILRKLRNRTQRLCSIS